MPYLKTNNMERDGSWKINDESVKSLLIFGDKNLWIFGRIATFFSPTFPACRHHRWKC